MAQWGAHGSGSRRRIGERLVRRKDIGAHQGEVKQGSGLKPTTCVPAHRPAGGLRSLTPGKAGFGLSQEGVAARRRTLAGAAPRGAPVGHRPRTGGHRHKSNAAGHTAPVALHDPGRPSHHSARIPFADPAGPLPPRLRQAGNPVANRPSRTPPARTSRLPQLRKMNACPDFAPPPARTGRHPASARMTIAIRAATESMVIEADLSMQTALSRRRIHSNYPYNQNPTWQR